MISLDQLPFWHKHEDAAGGGARVSRRARMQARKRGMNRHMTLFEVLTPEVIRVGLAGRTKEAIITELVDVLVSAGKVEDRDAALSAVLEREDTMSTGMQHGIAIPHGKTDSVHELVAALGTTSEGVDFDSVDGEPCQIFFMTLSPASKSGPHLLFMAGVTRLLQDETMRQQLLAAGNAEDVVRLIVEHGA